MTPENRAKELVEEWMPHDAFATVRAHIIPQLTVEFKHVMQQAYAAGHNACVKENVALNKNAVRPIEQPEASPVRWRPQPIV